MSKDQGARTRMPTYVTIPLAFAAIAAVLLLLWYRSRRDPSLHLIAAVPVGDRFLVHDELNRLMLVAADGTVTGQVDEAGGATIRAWARDAVWLSAPQRPLYARHLPSLSSAGPVEAAIASHSILPRGFQLRGLRPDGSLVLEGRDRQRYRVSLDGAIAAERDAEGASPVPGRRTEEQDNRRPEVGVSNEQVLRGRGPGILTGLDLILPSLVMDWPSGEPARFGDAPHFLILSRSLTGPDADHVLSRVGADQEVAWSVSAADMVGPTEQSSPVHRILGVSISGGRLALVVQATTEVHLEEMDGDIWSEPRVVTLDPRTGAVHSRSPLSGL